MTSAEVMDQSILTSIKKLLLIEEDYDYFDPDIIIHINSVLRICNQIGIGKRNFSIGSAEEKWSDFIDIDPNRYYDFPIDTVKSYVYLRVKQLFDPAANSFVVTSFENQIKELEWRMQVMADIPISTDSKSDEEDE